MMVSKEVGSRHHRERCNHVRDGLPDAVVRVGWIARDC
jgi:hypothetical protein